MTEHILYAPIQINRGLKFPDNGKLYDGELYAYPDEYSYPINDINPQCLVIGVNDGSGTTKTKHIRVKYSDISIKSEKANALDSGDVKINGGSYGLASYTNTEDANDTNIKFKKYLAKIGSLRILSDTSGRTHLYARDPYVKWNEDVDIDLKATLNDFIIRRSRFENCWINNLWWIRGKKDRLWGNAFPETYVEHGQIFFLIDTD